MLSSSTSYCSSPRSTNVMFSGGARSNDLSTSSGGTKRSISASNINEDNASLDSYYLLSSKKVWFSIALYTVGLSSLQTVLNQMGALTFHPFVTKAFISSKLTHFILPHLANACCILQLIGNLFLGVGCFGFNKIMGPCRPFFLSMLFLSTRSSIHQYLPVWNHVFIPWMIALMPEWIHLFNTYLVKQFRAKQTNIVKTANETNVSDILSAELELNISGMGCVACIQKIDSSTRNSSNNVKDASSWLLPKEMNGQKKCGKAIVLIKGGSIKDLEHSATKVIQAVEKAGFQCDSKQLTIKNEVEES